MLHLDTSFLIDLEREISRDRPGPAFEFLEALDPGDVLAVSVHAPCELRTGAELTRNWRGNATAPCWCEIQWHNDRQRL